MQYEKPIVEDLGSVAEHTFWGDWDGGCWYDCFKEPCHS
jgi:hypothetical protein